MKKFLIIVLCLLFCMPAIGLGEEYLVSDNSDVIPANALSSKFQTALDALNEGSLLDAVNGFAGLGSENGADQYSRYAYALLLIQREDPAAAIDLLNGIKPIEKLVDFDLVTKESMFSQEHQRLLFQTLQ